jgi:flagellar assembly protein FliH
MLCKIASAAQIVEPIAWRSAASDTPPKQSQPGPAEMPAQAPTFAASEDAERRLAELERARELDIAEGRRGGFEDGLRKGREEASAEVQKALDQLARTLHDLAQQKRKIRLEAEYELVKLALAVARRIMHRELMADPDSIQGIVHAALQKLQSREASRVRVNPAGAAAVRAALERNGTRPAIEITADPALPLGALLFETVAGVLDASVETQLQEIERGFADRLSLQ